MSWLGVFGECGEAKIVGTIELLTAEALIIGLVVPFASALGAALASATFVLTALFVFSTPGVTLHSPTGLPDHLHPGGAVPDQGCRVACCVPHTASGLAGAASANVVML